MTIGSTTLANLSFVGADGSAPTGVTNVQGLWTIQTNALSYAAGQAFSYLTCKIDPARGNDDYSIAFPLTNLGEGTLKGAFIRQSPGANGYVLGPDDTGHAVITKLVAGVDTVLLDAGYQASHFDGTFIASAEGANPVVLTLTNGAGTVLATYSDASSPIATGTLGFYTNKITTPQNAIATVLVKGTAAGALPATLSSPGQTGTIGTSTTAAPVVTSDTAGGTLYGVEDIPANITGITTAQIKAGHNNVNGAPLKVLTFSTPTVGVNNAGGVTGLTPSTALSNAFVQNTTGGDSNVATSTFTTAAPATRTAILKLFASPGVPLASTAVKVWTRLTDGGNVVDGGGPGLSFTTAADGTLTLTGLSIAAGAIVAQVLKPTDRFFNHVYDAVAA